MMKKRISLIFGTRPEAIKLCPLVEALRRHDCFEPHVCVTAQHRQMLDQVLEVFGVKPDMDLQLMTPGQSLAGLTARCIQGVNGYLQQARPALVLVQGDTTTTFCAALAAFYQHIPVGHVEAGLRTGNRQAPYPEEVNRILTTHLADLHFPPTGAARLNLVREGIPEEKIHVTGNTVIDALFIAVDHVRRNPPPVPGLDTSILSGAESWLPSKPDLAAGSIPGETIPAASTGHPLILITGHRRESFGEGFEHICQAIVNLARRYPAASFVYPVHLNPNVQGPVFRILGGMANVHLIEPVSYLPFVRLMAAATIILTDSGGVQEEAPALGKPVLVMRDTTERPEGVAAGTARLVGTDPAAIIEWTVRLLEDPAEYRRMARAINPYGDGQACRYITSRLQEYLMVT